MCHYFTRKITMRHYYKKKKLQISVHYHKYFSNTNANEKFVGHLEKKEQRQRRSRYFFRQT